MSPHARSLRWLSVLLGFALVGQPFAVGYREAGAREAMEGTVGFDLYHGYLIVARGSAGPMKGLTFLLDTGASPTVLDPRLARKLHLEQFPASISVLGGSVQAEAAIVPSLNFGPMQRDNVPVLIEDLSFLQKALPVRVDGVIGLDVLGQSAFVIDYASREIHFGPSAALPNSLPLRMEGRTSDRRCRGESHPGAFACGYRGIFGLPLCENYAGAGLGSENQRSSAAAGYDRRL